VSGSPWIHFKSFQLNVDQRISLNSRTPIILQEYPRILGLLVPFDPLIPGPPWFAGVNPFTLKVECFIRLLISFVIADVGLFEELERIQQIIWHRKESDEMTRKIWRFNLDTTVDSADIHLHSPSRSHSFDGLGYWQRILKNLSIMFEWLRPKNQ